MKISDAKKVAALVDKLAEQQKHIESVRTKSMELSFGAYSFTIAKPVEDDLRERILSGLILDLEKTKEELVKLGVEL